LCAGTFHAGRRPLLCLAPISIPSRSIPSRWSVCERENRVLKRKPPKRIRMNVHATHRGVALWPSFHGVADAIHASFTCSVHFAFTASHSRIPIGVLARSQIPCSTNASPVAPPQRCCLWPVLRSRALEQEFTYLRRSRGARRRRGQPGERCARHVESGPIERRRRQEVGSKRDRRAVRREARPWLPLDVLIPGALQMGVPREMAPRP